MKQPIDMMLEGAEWKLCPGATESAEEEYRRTGIPYATHEGFIEAEGIGRIDCVQLNTGERIIRRTPGSLLDRMLTELGIEEPTT